MRFLKELFAFMGLEGRVRLEWISSAEAQKFVKVMSEFTEEICALGPNPLCNYTFESRKQGNKAAACSSEGAHQNSGTDSPKKTKRAVARG
jgi:F420-non-reducing hydrogenase iron-sulfur subunit